MDDSRQNNIIEVGSFLEHSKKLDLEIEDLEEKYDFIRKTIFRFRYGKRKRKDKRTILLYLKKMTGYKNAHLHRLVKRALVGKLARKDYVRKNPSKRYQASDIKLLEHTDEVHLRLSASATKEILRREYEVFGKAEYRNVSQVSPSHINNLRRTNVYKTTWVNGTKSCEVQIGVTMPPVHNNMPGSIRVDSVHHREVFHLNVVDEVTQWEVVVCVPEIKREYLLTALKILLAQFPFKIFNFHSDRGSEFINQEVASVLNELLIKQTKSRSRHCNDNALIESKNGSVIRKNFGYVHIDQSLVENFNNFNRTYFNVYLNYHRPCLYVSDVTTNAKGRESKFYGQATTPYEKLKEVSREQKRNFLKDGLTFEKLDIIAYEMSDNEFAKFMRKEHARIYNLNTKLHARR